MSEVNALKTLRETTLAYLSQSDYEKIIKAVEVGGIDSLTGTASMIVKSAVLKHGSHDQSSHNPKKGGGMGGRTGGGIGGQPPEGTDSEALRENLSDMAGQREHLEDIASGKAKGKRGGQVTGQDEYVAESAQQTKDAASKLSEAEDLAVNGDLEGAAEAIDEARGNIQSAKDGFEDQNYHDLVLALDTIETNIESIQAGILNNKLARDMKDPFGDD